MWACVGAAAPATGCHRSLQPERTQLSITDKTPDDRDQLSWKWKKGPAVAAAELGNPLVTDGYELCLFDATGTAVMFASAPAGGLCSGRACWRAVGSDGFLYHDRDRTPQGVPKLLVRSGASGRPQVVLKGGGQNLIPARLPLALPVTVQLRVEGGSCGPPTTRAA